MRRLTKSVFVIGAIAILTGCFGGGEGAAGEESLDHTYINTEHGFEIKYPDTFLLVPKNDLPVGALAGVMDLMGGDFTSNVTVASEVLPEEISSLNFALANVKKGEVILPGYSLRRVEDLKVDGEETKLHLFTLDRGGMKTNFAQMYLTKGKKGYVVTATYGPDVIEGKEGTLLAITKSLRLEEEKE